MKILQVAQFYPPVIGGEERHVRNLSHALASRHEVRIVTFGAENATERREGLTVHTVRPATALLPSLYQNADRLYAPPVPDPVVARRLADIIRREHPDVIHAHNWIVNSVLVAQYGAGQVPVVLTLHDYSLACATKRYMYLDAQECSGPTASRCLRCVTCHYRGVAGVATYVGNIAMGPLRRHDLASIIAVSSAVAERNRLAEGSLPYEIVPNFIPDALVDLHPGAPPTGFTSGSYILFVGDISRDKGVDVLLRAYADLPAGRPSLLLVGRRTSTTPLALPVGAEIRDGVPHDRVMAAFAHAALVVAPSIWPDPCPTVVLEAMAAGRAVVTTRTGGMVDMIDDGVDGVLLPPGDADALAAAMNALMSDPRRTEAMGRAAHARAADFTASVVVPRIEQIYHDIAHIPGPSTNGSGEYRGAGRPESADLVVTI